MALPPFDHEWHPKSTEPPNPTWSYCQPIGSTPAGKAWLQGEEQGWKCIDTANYDPSALSKLAISAIVPRPIGFVSTVSDDGIENLAPFSFFNTVHSYPPIVSICCTRPGGTGQNKDTRNNIKNSRAGFTVNMISEPFIENANVTAIDAPPDFDEWSISGLTKAPSVRVKAPRVKESAFSMECELFKADNVFHPETGELTGTLVLGHVKYIHVRNDMLTEFGTIDPLKLKPVARLGDISYARLGDMFTLDTPIWSEEESKTREHVRRSQIEELDRDDHDSANSELDR